MVCVGFSLHIRLWRCITCPACSDLAHMKRIFLDVVSDRFLWIFCWVGRSRWAGASNLPTKHRRVLIQSRCTCFVTLAWVGARGNCLQAHPCGLHFERWYHDDRRYAQGVRHPWHEDSGFWLHQQIGPLDATQLRALLLGSLYSPWHQLILDFRQDLRDAARSFRNRAAIATNHRSA